MFSQLNGERRGVFVAHETGCVIKGSWRIRAHYTRARAVSINNPRLGKNSDVRVRVIGLPRYHKNVMMGVMSHRWGWAALIPAIFAAIFPAAAFAQWLSYPTPNVPRTPDGQPNLGEPSASRSTTCSMRRRF